MWETGFCSVVEFNLNLQVKRVLLLSKNMSSVISR